MRRSKGFFIAMIVVIGIVIAVVSGLSLQSTSMSVKDLESKLSGLEMDIRSFDEESNVIDHITGKSVMVERNTTFDTVTDGSSNKDSSVITITVGKNRIDHVGSSLIVAEKGLYDVFDEYTKTVDISNAEKRGVPVINSVVNSFKNITSGTKKTLLIRSQNGTPLATYVGDNVSIFSVDIPKSTAFLIDKKVLLVYRCDYTLYDTELLLDEH